MYSNDKGVDPEGASAFGQTTGPVWARAQAATNIDRRLLALLTLGLIAALTIIPDGRVTAQTFTTLHSFTAATNGGPPYYFVTNSDGVQPWGRLVTNSSGKTLYGTAKFGGSWGDGAIFAVNIDGTGFTNLYSFTANIGPGYTDYTNSDGAYPIAGLVLSGRTLYGTTRAGGTHKAGTVFAIDTDGTGFTNLYRFTAGGYDPSNGLTNSDGAYPDAGFILSGNTLYGTAEQGGSSGAGTVFAINTDGTGFTNLHTFTALSIGPPYPRTNNGGGAPVAGLILFGNTLYGTTYTGGSSGNGTVFVLHTNGTGFTTLHNFTALLSNTNSDGANPNAGLVVSGNTLYGTGVSGGSSGRGTVFAINTDGSGFTTLHSCAGGDGAGPHTGLILSGNALYGAALQGGSSGNGTVFSISFRPQLTIVPSGTNVILSWPISYAGFSSAGYYLQDTVDLLSPAGWSAADPFLPTIINGQLTVTRPMLGPQRSYRLSQ